MLFHSQTEEEEEESETKKEINERPSARDSSNLTNFPPPTVAWVYTSETQTNFFFFPRMQVKRNKDELCNQMS